MNDTHVLPCTCKHPFQDSAYGRGQRLHNRFAKGWRCTVCTKEQVDQAVVAATAGSAAK